MTTSSNAADIAGRIARLAKGLGYIVYVEASGLSESRYVYAAMGDAAPVKIRVSSHDLPPSYGVAEIDVAVDADRRETWRWHRAVAHLAALAGLPVPAAARAAATRAANKARAAAAVEAANGALIIAAAAARADADLQVTRAYPVEWAAAAAKTGRDRREARRLLRRRFEGAA